MPKIDLNKIAEKKKNLYKRLTPSQRRVAVAKDALAQINANIWKPVGFSYVFFDEPQHRTTCLLDIDKTKCQVCARGALFLAAVNKFNDYNPSKHTVDKIINRISRSQFGNVESRLWSKSQICDIEAMYECWNYDRYDTRWEKFYPERKNRLIAILKNIIRNKGKFNKKDPHDIGEL